MNPAVLPPLVVDLDGTLTPTDTLIESVLRLIKAAPHRLLAMPVWLLRGRAAFKAAVAKHADLSVDHLPLREPLLQYLQDQKRAGRRIVLATAAHESIAAKVASRLNLFDDVLASSDAVNLKGERKLAAIRERVGDGFVYAGDSRADLPIWRAAKGAILTDVSPRLAATVRRLTPIEHEFAAAPRGAIAWLRALRVHQWLKNLLIFVPLLTAFSFGQFEKLTTALLAFIAFSLAASGTYVLNDLWDLDADRAHPRKRERAFASAALPIERGVLVALVLLSAGVAIAAVVSMWFLTMLLAYVAATSAYSWWLKEYVLVDVLTLSMLYTLRILAGSVAIGVATSFWLLAFSVFVFLSLALIKRCSELVMLDREGRRETRGRDYRVADLVVLWPLGIAAALASVVVFGLFISAQETQDAYATPDLLWLTAMGLIYWLSRLWIKTSRGEMHDDPLVYAMRDRGSRLAILAMIAATIMAHSIESGEF